MGKGRRLTENDIRRIILLLSETDMTFPEIAARMGCSRSAIAGINTRCAIRVYNGLRLNWETQHAQSHCLLELQCPQGIVGALLPQEHYIERRPKAEP
jgi:hypothetical protein